MEKRINMIRLAIKNFKSVDSFQANSANGQETNSLVAVSILVHLRTSCERLKAWIASNRMLMFALLLDVWVRFYLITFHLCGFNRVQ